MIQVLFYLALVLFFALVVLNVFVLRYSALKEKRPFKTSEKASSSLLSLNYHNEYLLYCLFIKRTTNYKHFENTESYEFIGAFLTRSSMQRYIDKICSEPKTKNKNMTVAFPSSHVECYKITQSQLQNKL